jgi:hypothetical protein
LFDRSYECRILICQINQVMKSVVFQRTVSTDQPQRGKNYITLWLKGTHTFWFTLYASFCAFSLYTCVYAFRKTFAAATFENNVFLGIDCKVWLVTFQVCGYALSKFIGIRIIAELKAHSRNTGILILSVVAASTWLLFGLIPFPYKFICLFINGLSLGLVWGMVFGYLEGRRVTEVLGAALSVSFIFSSGLCRTVGAYLMYNWHVSENWMPFVASCIFFIPLICFLTLLDKIPPPSAEDERLRTRRQPMSRSERKQFIKTFLPGIVLFIIAYMLLTAFRDFRDNFSAEVWKELGYGNLPGIYTQTEIPVSLGVLAIVGAVMMIKKNNLALMINHLIIISGMVLVGVSTFLFSKGLIGPPAWMTLIGLGLYMGYVPFNSIFFDRIIATFRYVATVGFIMYVADAFGYLGSISVLFFKEFTDVKLSWLEFLVYSGYILSITATVLMAGSMFYFYTQNKKQRLAAGTGEH